MRSAQRDVSHDDLIVGYARVLAHQGDCMIPWLLTTAPSPRDLTRAVATALQSKGVSSPPSSTRS
jgi:hypothetical protein